MILRTSPQLDIICGTIDRVDPASWTANYDVINSIYSQIHRHGNGVYRIPQL